MEENNEKSVISYAMEGGLLMGAIFVIRDILEMLIHSGEASFGGLCLLSLISVLSFLATLYVVVVVTKKVKVEALKENVTYPGILVFGVYLFCFGSVIYASYLTVVVLFLKPDLLATQKAYYDALFVHLSSMEGATPATIDYFKGVLNEAYTDMMALPPQKFAIDSMLGLISNGFFLSLISSIFLCRKNK